MFRAFALTLVVSAALHAHEVALFNGRVIDASGMPVTAAAVTLSEQSGAVVFRTVTNDEGEFFFADVLPGTYLIDARAQWLSTPTAYGLKLVAGVNPGVQLVLILSAASEQAIDVTAAAAPQSADETSRPIDGMMAARAENRGLFTLADTLRFLPGLRVSSFGAPGAYTEIQTGGLPARDTAVLIDGSPFRDPASPHDDASALIGQLLLVNTSRVEALRGSASSLYGSGAVAGAVNILTAGGGGGPLHGNFDVQGGGLGLFEGVARLAGTAAENKLSYVAGIAHLGESDAPAGESARDWTGQGGVQYAFSPTVRAAADLFGSTLASTPGTPAVPDVYGVAQTASRFFDGLFRFSQELTPGFSYRISYALLTTGRTVAADRYDGRLDTVNARASYSGVSNQLLSAGYEFTREHYLDRSPETSTAGQDFQSLYGQDQIALLHSRLLILLSGRYTGVTAAGLKASALTGDASAAYFFQRTGTKVRAHAGNSFRMPSLYERFGGYFDAGAFHAVGNPALSPERALSGDVGIDQYAWARRVRLSATYYATNLRQAILFSPGARTYYNMPLGLFNGVEVSAELRPSRQSTVAVSYEYAGLNEVKFIATQAFGHGFDAAADFEGGSSYLGWGIYRLSGPRQLGIAGGYRFALKERLNARLYVRLSNALNQDYIAGEFRTPRRWAVAGLQFGF